MQLTQSRLKELLHYNQNTGEFLWLKTVNSRAMFGSIAGYDNPAGYSYIRVDNTGYLAHRLVFLYMEGAFPPDQVDHINRDKHDNRWCNLRHADRYLNHSNKCTNNKFIGVYWRKGRDRWCARTRNVNGRHKIIGSFKTHLAACYARHAYEIRNDLPRKEGSMGVNAA